MMMVVSLFQLRLLPPPPICCYSSPAPNERRYHSTVAAAAHKRSIQQVKALLHSGEADSSHSNNNNNNKPDEEDEEFQVLTAVQTTYNKIVIIDTPKSTLLLLDSTHNVHSMLNKSISKWTGSYWDEFATLPPVVPPGPIAIFGLGGGTAAHLMLHLWPSLQLEGWEIDGILIDKSRDYLGLCDLEKHTTDGGVLNIHIGDVFSPRAAISGGYAAIIVDLFADGKVLPQLEQAATWLELNDKLMPNGRFMVNCGAGEEGSAAMISQNDDSSMDDTWRLNATIRALCEAFPGQVNWKKMAKSAGENYMALTGPLPELSTWSAALPNELNSGVNQWRTCN